MTERNEKRATELSLKRLLYLVLAVAVLGGVFLVVNNPEPEAASPGDQGAGTSVRTYFEGGSVSEEAGPLVWIL